MENREVRFLRAGAATVLMTLMGLANTGMALAADPSSVLKPKEVKALIVSAKTSADHLKLARHFTAMAEKHEAEALEHEALAVEYAKKPEVSGMKHPMSGRTAEHCKYYAEHCRKAAKEMRSMAAAHQSMADSSK